MAKNKETGDDQRVGAVKKRSQVKSPVSGNWTKRDTSSGKFLDQKEDGTKFKGVRAEKKAVKKTPAKKVATKKGATKKIAAKKMVGKKKK
jgi:hypothetical protein